MLVILLILFLNVTYTVNADSNENKYIDLLPDQEKRDFIEKVARKIIKDVESKEKGQKDSVELSNEQLKEHDDYVKELLKQETDNIRRSKGQVNSTNVHTDTDEDSLIVKPLAKDKKDPMDNLDNVDLTLRAGKENPSEELEIKVEVITDEVPIIKRSIQNKTDKGGKDSKSLENEDNATKNPNIDSVSDSPKFRSEMENYELGNSVNTNSDETKSTTTTTNDDDDTTTVEPVKESIESSTSPETTTIKAENEDKPVNTSVLTRRAGNDTEKAKKADSKPILDYFGLKVDNNTDDNDSSKKVTEESLIETTTNDENTDAGTESSETKKNDQNESAETTTPFKDETTVLPTTTAQDSWSASNEDAKDKSVEITTSTLTSTMTDEGTTDLVIETTSYEPPTYLPTITTEPTTTKNEIEMTTKSVLEKPTTVEEKNTEDDVTTPPNKSTEITTIEVSTITPPNNGSDFKPRVWDSQETTEESKVDEETGTTTEKTHKDEENGRDKSLETTTDVIKTSTNTVATTTEAAHLTTTPIKRPKAVTKAPQKVILTEITIDTVDKDNKNFIELEKVYYNNTPKEKKRKIYEVYEIPADVPPFIKKPGKKLKLMSDEPYYVPVYNYSPNNAYYNPHNRLGPNANDNPKEIIELETITEEESTSDDELNLDIQEFDMDYYGSGLSIERKKFSNVAKKRNNHRINNNLSKKRNRDPNDNDLEPDYFYGRIRKDLNGHNGEDFVPNSDELQHPVHSIQELNLKDHVRAVRNILFRQGNFGEIHPNEYDVEKEPEKQPKKLRSGKMQRLKAKKEPDTDDRLKKIGTFNNSTKGLYVIDEKLKDDVLDYIKNQNNDIVDIEELTRDKSKTSKWGRDDNNKKMNLTITGDSDKLEAIKEFIKYGETRILHDRKRMGLNLKLQRRNDDVKIGVYLEVLKDLVSTDSKALVQYDWLGTTVDIQASLQKLFELIGLVTKEESIHPADMEILRYVVFLHKLALEIIQANEFGSKLKLLLPRKKSKRQGHLLKERGLLNRVWLYLRKKVPSVDDDDALRNFNKFLMDIEDSLYDLHDAIKNIAKITKYKNQHWYQNLKDVYLNTEEKYLLELLLHMSVSRLFSMVEDSATKGLEDDYVVYMKRNRAVAKKTLEEMLFVIEIIGEINKYVE